MGKFIDRTGHVFGRLTVVRQAKRLVRSSPIKWECVCECGGKVKLTGGALQSGNTKSCGCIHREMMSQRNTTHGLAATAEYRSWSHMKERCNNPSCVDYPNYGGRGVRVCERWSVSFENFLEDMGPRPTPRHSIDRFPSQDGDYCKENCRWATPKEQANNTRRNHYLTFDGRTQTLTQWGEEVGASQSVLRQRLNLGWPVERVLTTPVRQNSRSKELSGRS